MLEPIKQFLKTKTIILASGSPRRKQIFEHNLGLNVLIHPSTFAEDLLKSDFATPVDYVKENSRLKALDVAGKLTDWFLIVGADTVVAQNNHIYEKPENKEDAFKTLKQLSNSRHHVCTGVTLIMKKLNSTSPSDFQVHTFDETTEVDMAELSDDVIRAYVETGEPLDKAGSYGIQGLGCSLVKSLKGDYFNVMGFPAHKFAVELKRIMKDYENQVDTEISLKLSRD